jgi:hypothetical protein
MRSHRSRSIIGLEFGLTVVTNSHLNQVRIRSEVISYISFVSTMDWCSSNTSSASTSYKLCLS